MLDWIALLTGNKSVRLGPESKFIDLHRPPGPIDEGVGDWISIASQINFVSSYSYAFLCSNISMSPMHDRLSPIKFMMLHAEVVHNKTKFLDHALHRTITIQ